MSEVDASAVADAARAVPGVVALSSGPTDQFRSYLTGGRSVVGVRSDDRTLRVNLVASFGTPLPALGDAVRAAVAPLAGGREVIVAVDDLADPSDGTGPGDGTDPGDGAPTSPAAATGVA